MLDITLVAVVLCGVFLVEVQARKAGHLALGEDTTGVFAVLAGALTALAVVLMRDRSLAGLGFRRPKRWLTVPVWAVAILVAYIAGQLLFSRLVGSVVDLPAPDLSRYDNLYLNPAAALMMAAVVPLTASIPEEIIYRGFLMDRLTRVFGAGLFGLALTVVIQGAVFGLAHFQWGVGGMLVTALMGIVWGTAFLLCGRNLWIVILAHAGGDLLLVAQLYFVKGSEIGAG